VGFVGKHYELGDLVVAFYGMESALGLDREGALVVVVLAVDQKDRLDFAGLGDGRQLERA
jgi:hypothetical protein